MILRFPYFRNKLVSPQFTPFTFLLLFSFSLIATTTLLAQATPTRDERSITQEDRELIKFKKNRVKTRTAIITYHGSYAKAMPGEVINEYIICDERGNKIEHTRFKTGETVDTKWVYEYDEKGNTTKLTGIDDYGRVVYTRTSKYDNNSNEVERNEVRSTINDSFKTVFKYNNAGLVTKLETFNSKGVKIWSEKFIYDGKKLLEQSSYNEQGENVSVTKYKHNSAGLIIDEIDSTPGKDAQSVATYIYDNKGNVTEHKTGSFRQVFSYNQNGDVVLDVLYNILGNRQHKFELTYDDRGLLKERNRFSPVDKLVYTVKYEYEFY